MTTFRTHMHYLSRLTNVFKILQGINSARQFQTSILFLSKSDPLKIFMRDDVQTLINRMTHLEFNIDRVFPAHKVKTAAPPKYKALTDAELDQELQSSQQLINDRLQIPPFMNPRKQRDTLITDDPEIAPVLTSKFVFIDIADRTKRIKSVADRPVVCRHENGQLRHADWDTVDRLCQMFAPVPCRKIYKPKMFDEEQLEKILEPEKYMYILERACIQFEPDSSDFIRVTQRVYEHASTTGNIGKFLSTRFFGHMCFYFAWINSIDPVLVLMLKQSRPQGLQTAVDLIKLRNIIHNKPDIVESPVKVLQSFLKKESRKEYVDELGFLIMEVEKSINTDSLLKVDGNIVHGKQKSTSLQ